MDLDFKLGVKLVIGSISIIIALIMGIRDIILVLSLISGLLPFVIPIILLGIVILVVYRRYS